MEAKHTPGPWVADIRMGVFAVYPQSEEIGGCLAECVKNEVVRQYGKGEPAYEGGYRLLTEDQEANARLISSAPELLELVERIRSYFDVDDSPLTAGMRMYRDDIDAAIAKAKGEA